MEVLVANVPLPAVITPASVFTDDDLLRFCAANNQLRVERMSGGALRVMNPAGSGTGAKNSEINYQLMSWSRSGGGGVVFDSSAGFTLPDVSMLSPDAAWMSSGKWDALSAEEQARFAPACPEFVIELRSPSDSLPELQAKMELWIANGAELAWLVDPVEAVVWVYRPDGKREQHNAVSTVQGDGPIRGFDLVLSRVWGG